jgi:allantoin racemase
VTDRPPRIWYQSFTDPDVDEPYFERLRAYLQSAAPPGCVIDLHGLQPGDRYLHPITEFRCAGQVLRNALIADRDGYDAFVIGHFQEPGLQEARAALRMPVVGLGEVSMLYACTLGRKIGLVTINPIFIPYHEVQIARYGLSARVVAVRAVQGQVADYNRAFTDPPTYAAMREDFLAQVRPMLDEGVDVILPAGGYPMLLFAREHGFQVDAAPVVNGLPIALRMAQIGIELRRANGVEASRRSTYALPPQDAVAEFLGEG